MEVPIEVDQSVAIRSHANARGLHEHHRVRADFLQIDDLALQAGQRVTQDRHTMCAFIPDRPAEAFFHRHLGHAGEVACQQLVLARQYVEANVPVALEGRVHRARSVQAYEQRGRRIGNGAHGARGHAATSVRSGRRDDIHGRAEMRHGLTELLSGVQVGFGVGSRLLNRRHRLAS